MRANQLMQVGISALVLLATFMVIAVILLKPLPPGNEQVALLLLGWLIARASDAVGYWLGSSSGSADKTEMLKDRKP